MKDVNKVILVGRLGADPVLRESKNGTPYSYFPVATSRKFREAGELDEATLKEETQWHRVVAWGKQGELCSQYLKKGHAVFVEGAGKSRGFAGKDGTQRFTFEVHVENISFLGGRRPAALATEGAQASAEPVEAVAS